METKNIYMLISVLRDAAGKRSGDDRMLMLGSANYLERLLRENEDLRAEKRSNDPNQTEGANTK